MFSHSLHASTDWHPVEDKDQSNGLWQLLWQENEYRWTPEMASATAPHKSWITRVESPGGEGYSPERVYDSGGGWSGLLMDPNKNLETNGGSLPSGAWPCAYGTP